MDIVLDTQLTKDGIVCTHPVLGQVATIKRQVEDHEWYVFPYAFSSCAYGRNFRSMKAAEFYALALAYEMVEKDKG